MIDLPTQIKCAQRELAMRQRVYPRLVAQGRMTKDKADHETQTMQAIVNTLSNLARSEELPMHI